MTKQPGDEDNVEQTPNGGARPVKSEFKRPAAGSPDERMRRGILGIQEQLRRSGVFAIQEGLRQSAVFRAAEEWQRAMLSIQEKFHESGLLGIEKVLKESSMASLVDSVSDIQGTLGAFREWAKIADDEVIDDDTLLIGPDGSVTLAGETATAAEVESAFQDLFDRFNDFLTNVRSALLRLRKPVRALILWFASTILIPFLISYHFQRQASLELQEMQQRLQLDSLKTRREVIAAIKKLGPAHPDVSRSKYRVVIRDGVRVRSRPNSRTPAKGLLPLGTVVHFIEKRGPWTAIEYLAPGDGGSLRGWVLNKYLKRLE